MLSEEQKTQRLKCARELLKTYKGRNSRVISNLLTGDETWMHMFEPQRRADNKQWKRKDRKRPCIAKRTISSKKMLWAIFFNSSGPVIQVIAYFFNMLKRRSNHPGSHLYFLNTIYTDPEGTSWFSLSTAEYICFYISALQNPYYYSEPSL